MTNDELIKAVEVLAARTRGFERRTLARIGKRIQIAGRLSQADAQAIRNILDVTGDMDAITKDLAVVTGLNISDIKKLYEQILTDDLIDSKPLYDFRNVPFLPFKDNVYVQAIARRWAIETAGQMMNLATTKSLGFTKYNLDGAPVGFMPIEEALTETLDKAVVAVSTGTETFEQAMRSSIIELGGSGVKSVYESGRQIRMDSIVRAYILYGAKQAEASYQDHISEQLKCDMFYVSHSGVCRDSHLFMDCNEFVYGTERADKALEHLQDYNCRHTKTDGIKGVSQNPYTPEQRKELHDRLTQRIEYKGKTKQRNDWIQEQRAIERNVRKQRDIEVLAKASGDKKLAAAADRKANILIEKYYDLCENVGIQPTPERMRIAYGKPPKRRTAVKLAQEPIAGIVTATGQVV